MRLEISEDGERIYLSSEPSEEIPTGFTVEMDVETCRNLMLNLGKAIEKAEALQVFNEETGGTKN